MDEAENLTRIVLIIDDESEVAKSCARVLKRAGIECVTAFDGPPALALFDSHRPALVLCDINLPTGDGFEIARYVQQKSPKTPVVLMTADHNANSHEQAMRAGAAHYLRKPFANAELVQVVGSLLANSDSGSGTC